jgi:hypothetical protein
MVANKQWQFINWTLFRKLEMRKKKTSTTNENVHNYINHALLFSIACVILAVSSTIFYYVKYKNITEELNEYKTGYALKTWAIGDEVDTPDYTISVKEINIDKIGIPKYLPAPEGKQFVAVDLTVKNRTSTEAVFLPINSSYLRDQDGIKYAVTTAPNVEEGIAGQIAPGDTARGMLGYLVPQDISELRFYFEPYGEQAGKTITIDLSDSL